MKKIIPFFLFSIITLFSACDNIPSNERFIEIPSATIRRNVLVEEFTGQRCINCPNAAATLETLQKDYTSDHLIVVGIHGGDLAFNGNSRIRGLRTTLGDTYYKQWDITSLPHAMINRRASTNIIDKWAGYIYDELQQETPLDIVLTCQYNVNLHNVEIKTLLNTTTENIEGRLQLWLLEDSITTLQLMPDGSANTNYIHNHVLRASINGEQGTEIKINKGESNLQTQEYILPTDVLPHHAYVIAFVYNERGVFQVVRQKLVK